MLHQRSTITSSSSLALMLLLLFSATSILQLMLAVRAQAQTTTNTTSPGEYEIADVPPAQEPLLGRIALDCIIAASVSLAFLLPVILTQSLTLVKIAPPRTRFEAVPPSLTKGGSSRANKGGSRGVDNEDEDDDFMAGGVAQIGSYYHGALGAGEPMGLLRSEFLSQKKEMENWKKRTKKYEKYQKKLQAGAKVDASKAPPENPGAFSPTPLFISTQVSTVMVASSNATNNRGGGGSDEEMLQIGGRNNFATSHMRGTTIRPLSCATTVSHLPLSTSFGSCPVDEILLPNAKFRGPTTPAAAQHRKQMLHNTRGGGGGKQQQKSGNENTVDDDDLLLGPSSSAPQLNGKFNAAASTASHHINSNTNHNSDDDDILLVGGGGGGGGGIDDRPDLDLLLGSSPDVEDHPIVATHIAAPKTFGSKTSKKKKTVVASDASDAGGEDLDIEALVAAAGGDSAEGTKKPKKKKKKASFPTNKNQDEELDEDEARALLL